MKKINELYKMHDISFIKAKKNNLMNDMSDKKGYLSIKSRSHFRILRSGKTQTDV